MFVFPVNREAELSTSSWLHAAPLELPPDEIEANRDRWGGVDGHRRAEGARTRWGPTPRGCGEPRSPSRSRSHSSSILSILERGLRADGSLASPLDVLTDPLTRDVVWFMFWQALRRPR